MNKIKNASEAKYSININFTEIDLPPVKDIMVLGKGSSQGKIGLSKSINFLSPDAFETIDVVHENVEAIFISKRIIKKLPIDRIISVLEERVFPYVSDNEIIKVNFHISLSFDTIEID